MKTSLAKIGYKAAVLLRMNPARIIYKCEWLMNLFREPYEVKYFVQKWPGVIWDVGAAVGKYTTVLADNNPDSTIVAFEPNFNSIDYLANRTCKYSNVILVPSALTKDGRNIKGQHKIRCVQPASGPMTTSISVDEAVKRFGVPSFIKLDIDGGEKEFFDYCPSSLLQTTMLITWHSHITLMPVPDFSSRWKPTFVTKSVILLEPKNDYI